MFGEYNKKRKKKLIKNIKDILLLIGIVGGFAFTIWVDGILSVLLRG